MGLLGSIGRQMTRGRRGFFENIRGNMADGPFSAALTGGLAGGAMSAGTGGTPEQIAQDALTSAAYMGGGQLFGGALGLASGMAGTAALPFVGGADGLSRAVVPVADTMARAVLQTAQRAEDIPQLVMQAAQSQGIDPQAVMQSIQRMLQGG